MIDTNKRDISFNSGVISNIKNNSTIIHDGVYNETFILSNRNITTQSQIIFKKIINFDFSNNGFFNILRCVIMIKNIISIINIDF